MHSRVILGHCTPILLPPPPQKKFLIRFALISRMVQMSSKKPESLKSLKKAEPCHTQVEKRRIQGQGEPGQCPAPWPRRPAEPHKMPKLWPILRRKWLTWGTFCSESAPGGEDFADKVLSQLCTTHLHAEGAPCHRCVNCPKFFIVPAPQNSSSRHCRT